MRSICWNLKEGNGYSASLYSSLDRVVEIAKTQMSSDGALIEDTTFLDKVAQVEIQINAMEATELRILGSLSAGQNVGPESSLLKTRGTEIGQLITELAVENCRLLCFAI